MKKIALFSGSHETAKSLYRQLRDFIPENFNIKSYVVDDGIKYVEMCDLEIFSSSALFDEIMEMGILNENSPKIIGKRTINYDKLDLVVSIPDKTRVLLVNDLESTARETLQAMEEIGLNHIQMELYYPDAKINPGEYKIAITPGEIQYVPIQIENIIDIGSRIFDFTTIAKILTQLNLLETSSGSFSKMYLEKIINIAKGLAKSRNQVVQLNDHLERVIDSFNEGLLMFDAQYKIVVFNDVLKQILKIRKYMFVGNSLNRVIQNKKLLMFLMNSEISDQLDINLDGNDYVVNKFRLDKNELICVSFKSLKDHNLSKEAKTESIRKGYLAKYDLDDIVGTSAGVMHVKEVIRKLAKTDMTILIQGESGTGKELTASAIHNHSSRKDEPFLAVNFSALPDDLIESELFGYSEGAFTGAKKGGKTGLFEEANGGTIFLDEIGDVSLKVQLRLLRVLEEKEIMPLGANEIRPVDVRIIAATNKDLNELVNKKLFREDLYYRLKMGYIHLKPLRERREDIPLLCDHIMQSASTQNVEFAASLKQRLSKYHWPGNVRELKNTIIYMLAVRKGESLTEEDLPVETFFSRLDDSFKLEESFKSEAKRGHEGESLKKYERDFSNNDGKKVFLTGEERHFLDIIYNFTKADKKISRQTLAEVSEDTKFVRSENQVRRILNELKAKKLIEMHKGRLGIQLSKDGYEFYE